MLRIIVFLILLAGLIPMKLQAQWLEYYYAFELKDADGDLIDSANSNYKLTPVKNYDSSDVLLDIEICTNKKTWRYTEGYKDFDLINKLRIDRLSDGAPVESMIVEFLPAFNKGKINYYSNLYLGVITFKNGIHKIKLPETVKEWNSLKELKDLCPQSYEYGAFLDISKFQK